MAIATDILAPAGTVITTAQSYVVPNRQGGQDPTLIVLVRATVNTLGLGITVNVSMDGVNYNAVYVDAVPMTAAKMRRIVFSNSSAVAVPAESATLDATITQPMILEPFIQVVLTPGASTTFSLTVLQTSYR